MNICRECSTKLEEAQHQEWCSQSKGSTATPFIEELFNGFKDEEKG